MYEEIQCEQIFQPSCFSPEVLLKKKKKKRSKKLNLQVTSQRNGNTLAPGFLTFKMSLLFFMK